MLYWLVVFIAVVVVSTFITSSTVTDGHAHTHTVLHLSIVSGVHDRENAQSESLMCAQSIGAHSCFCGAAGSMYVFPFSCEETPYFATLSAHYRCSGDSSSSLAASEREADIAPEFCHHIIPIRFFTIRICGCERMFCFPVRRWEKNMAIGMNPRTFAWLFLPMDWSLFNSLKSIRIK